VEDQSATRIKEIKKYLVNNTSKSYIRSLRYKPVKPPRQVLEKRFLSLLKQENQQSINEKNLLRNELRYLLLNIDEIKTLPANILALSLFSHFECCHILVHEKGKPIGLNYFYRFSDEDSSKTISVQSFNNIYSLVKKSKNKIFNQSNTLKDDLDLVGNFLAKEIDLKNHSVIFLISRNSFLPPSEDEQHHFLYLCSFLSPLLYKLLDKEKNDFKKEVLIKALKNFPEKIFVKDQNRIIFSNDRTSALTNELNLMSFPLGGTDGLIMELSNLSKDTISTEIYHTQRIALLGELLNTLQHELSNPLFGLNLTSALLMSESKNPEVLETLNDICQNAIRSQTIIKNFSNLYNDQQELKKLNLVTLIEETITLTKSESKEIKKEIECLGFNRMEGLLIETNPTYLTQIIFNLIINAAQAIKIYTSTPHRHNICIKIENSVQNVLISIIDDGPGIKNELVADIFKPFFTTKESGTGLGLSICKKLAIQLNAEINFKNNSPLPGTTFSINLPK
jgi:signal transduction histidine kinase